MKNKLLPKKQSLFGLAVPFQFSSRLAPLLTEFLSLRHRLGYAVARRNALYAYRELDYFFGFYGVTCPDQIDRALVVRWMFALPRLSARSKNMRLQRLGGFCKYLVRLGHLKEDPTHRVSYLRERPAPAPYLYSLQDLGALLQAAFRWTGRYNHRFPGWVMATVIYLAYACGLRLGEVLNLKIKDIDFAENTLSLTKTKFHKERLAPFSQATARRLSHYLAQRARRHPTHGGPEDFLFRHKHGRYSSCGIQYLFSRLRLEAGLVRTKGPRFHDLRHTFAVHRLYKWYQDGADPLNKLSYLSTYMGHVSIDGTQRYLTITQSLLREGDKRFAAQFEDAVRKRLPR